MKKIILTLLLMSFALISGCDRQVETQNSPSPDTTPVVGDTQSRYKKNSRYNNPPADITGWELLGICEVDVTADGEEDKIELYTSAQRDMTGELMWDDSQFWSLRVNGRELFYERLNGDVYFNVSDHYNNGKTQSVIALMMVTGAHYEIREYYIENNEAYETSVYTTDDTANEGINLIYSSIPDYE